MLDLEMFQRTQKTKQSGEMLMEEHALIACNNKSITYWPGKMEE
jgi:hypothetical protein